MATTTEPAAAGVMPAADPEGAGVMPATSGKVPAAVSDGPAGVTPAAGVMPAADQPPDDLTTLRRALAAERSARGKAEDELKKRDDAQLSETEKLQRKVADQERELVDRDRREQETKTRMSVMTAAVRKGFEDPEDAVKMLNASELVFENGEPTNVGPLLDALLKDKPYLAANRPVGSFDQGARGNGAAGAPVFRASQLNDRAFYEANRDAIMLAQRENRIVDDNPK
jgi:hypothetical protein